MPGGFRHFPKLPPEIRLMIWKEAMPDPRVFEVLDSPNAKQKTPPHAGLMFANVHHEPPPSLAAVCQESRDFVLRHYQPLKLSGTTKYLDLSRDVLLLEPYLLVKRLLRTLHFLQQMPQIWDKISRLALGTSYGVYTGICHPILSWKVSKNNVAKLLEKLARFPKLESLVFIVHQDFRFEFDFQRPCVAQNQPYSYPYFASSNAMSYLDAGSFYTSLSKDGHYPSSATAAHSLPTPAPSPSPQSPRMSSKNDSQLPPSPRQQPSPLPSPYQSSLPTPRLQHSQISVAPQLRSQMPQIQPQSQQPQPPNNQHPYPYQQHQPNLPPHTILPLHRPQLVHQAYRFKFDIETNINYHMHRRHHVNELLYYPLDIDEEKEDHLLDLEEEEDPEWCDPWPTNDDWRRFRRRFQRAVHTTIAHAEGGPRGKMLGGRSWAKPGVNDGIRGGGLKGPKIEGASLLWRYVGGDGKYW